MTLLSVLYGLFALAILVAIGLAVTAPILTTAWIVELLAINGLLRRRQVPARHPRSTSCS